MRFAPVMALALVLPLAAAADGVFEGRRAELRALIIPEEGEAPQLSSRAIALAAGPGIELPSMRRVRAGFGDDTSTIVEISVDLQPDQILIGYAGNDLSTYSDGYFVGYEFRLPDLPQIVIDGASLDPVDRLPGMVDADLRPIPGGLWLDVGGRPVDPEARIRIHFRHFSLPGV